MLVSVGKALGLGTAWFAVNLALAGTAQTLTPSELGQSQTAAHSFTATTTRNGWRHSERRVASLEVGHAALILIKAEG
jgi:hypothetical protein